MVQSSAILSPNNELMKVDLIFFGKEFNTPIKALKKPKHSDKYVGKEPFIEGQQYDLGKYVGIFRDCFVFRTEQKDSEGMYLANFVAQFEEEVINSLLAKN